MWPCAVAGAVVCFVLWVRGGVEVLVKVVVQKAWVPLSTWVS